MKASLIVVVFALYFSSSCKDSNQDTDTTPSTFLVDDQLFTISMAGLVNLGADPDKKIHEGYMNVLLFVTEGIDFKENNTGELILKGAGALLGIVFFSEDEATLTPRDYFINLRPPYKVNDIGIGFYSLDFREENVVGPYFEYDGVALLSGKMTVEKIFNKNKITLNLINEEGIQIEATYTGPLRSLQSNIKPLTAKKQAYVTTLYPKNNSN